MHKFETAIIRQPAGIGDIFFCQKIAKKLVSTGGRVIWPVSDEFLFLSDYLEADGVEYISEKEIPEELVSIYNKHQNVWNINSDGVLYVPLQHADHGRNVNSVMHAKYDMVGLDWSDWADYFEFNIDFEKSESLMKRLNLDLSEPFVVVNRNYGSPPNSVTCPYIKFETDMRVIEMEFIEGYNVFDWYEIIQYSKQLHTVETSLNYIIEKMKGGHDCPTLIMYSKHSPPNYNHVRDLFNKNWIWTL